jgi:septum formation protein
MSASNPSIEPPRLVLASTSPYRRELLTRLGLAFTAIAPETDETRFPDEPPEELVRRLSEAKARAVAARHPDALVIGSDQVAVSEDEVLGKPGGHEAAVAQLQRLSGRRVSFLTGLCLLNARTGEVQLDLVPFHVVFRPLDDTMIEHYLQRERPYNCAGSFKSEGLGIALFERLEGDDPTALIGLPLIRLTRMLEQEGLSVL